LATPWPILLFVEAMPRDWCGIGVYRYWGLREPGKHAAALLIKNSMAPTPGPVKE
jgi:hypothetical protein